MRSMRGVSFGTLKKPEQIVNAAETNPENEIPKQ